ncbi:MAG TPA: hypothetical protein DCY72_05985 [Ruminococcaceae bacterium]|nr:hypothetical protein [Oscillospiraceae bacterium]
MKKVICMRKRIISFTLVLCMVLTCVMSVGFSVSAQQTDSSSTGEDYGLPQNCADGNILHCFNWTLSQIKAELPQIAAAGFTSVQTSPLQPHDGNSHWYWLYQPTKFTVGNDLGSYNDLKALCTEAHKYGVKIIVDVVANHVAGSDNGNLANAVDSVFKNNKSTYFHNLGARGNADDRYSTTQKNIGMPDLNSENTAIQNMVYNMVVNLKNAGVDGIRWDAAKHIALPSENCAFWSKMAQIDIFQYGEILGSPADGATSTQNKEWITEYAQYIGVSDTVYSAALMSAVRDGTTYKNAGNWNKSIDASKIVNWSESHDSYSNEPNYGGWTKNLSQNVVDKAYALLAARKDSQTLYLSRPFQTAHQSINYGVKGSTHFTSSEITAVNQFHNAMIGKEEKVLGGSTYYAVLREGGAVIVPKTNDTDVSISNTNAMVPAGTYVDKVSGNTFTVTDKTITGHVGSTGIAVLYDGEPEEKILIGDVDQDGKITVIDVAYIQQKLVNIRDLSAEGALAADTDQDGKITVIDAAGIQRYLADVDSPRFHVGEYITG